MKHLRRLLNIEYSFIQGFYWMGFCIVGSFGALFLQGRGYTNASLGVVMAIGNILGFLLGPVLASMIDRYRKVTVFTVTPILLAVQAAVLAILLFLPEKSLLLSLCFIVYTACHVAGNGINTQLSVDLELAGYPINYGVSRGIGSAAYVLISVILGYSVSGTSVSILPAAGLLLVAAQLCSNRSIFHSSRPILKTSLESAENTSSSSSIPAFLSKNRRFCVLLAGIGCIFFAHNLVNTFLINVVSNVGGDTTSLGNLNGFMAAWEIPAMFLFASVTANMRCSRVLRFSVLLFALKALCIALAPSLPLLYAAHVLQALSFAVFTPAMVQYVTLHISRKDSAKGQTLAFGMTTMGSVFASLFGGIMFDHLTVSATLLITAGVSFLGMFICMAGIESET